MASWSSWTGLVMVVVTVGTTTPGCSGKVLDSAAVSGIPAGCESSLRHREAGEPRCDASPEQCAQVPKDTRRAYNFIFSFFNSNEDTKTLDCFVGFLRSQGAKAEVVHWNDIPGIVPGTYVTATGTFEEVAPALRFAIVAAYGVTCSDTCTGSFCPGADSSTGSCSAP